MTDPGYLRFPHLHENLIAFTAEDDVWLAPLDGGRAWRASADQVPVSRPRFSPDGAHIAWTSTRDGAPEVHLAPVGGGAARRLTHWGDQVTRVVGWTPDGRVLVRSTANSPNRRDGWLYAVPVDGGPAERQPYGPAGGASFGPDGAVLLVSTPAGSEPSHWKRYRGGTAGKLWIDRAGDGGFVRVHQELDGNIEAPMWIGDRIAFLSDHEGTGRLYSSLPDGSDLRAHSPAEGFYARGATTDGTRVVWHAGGDLFLLDSLDGSAEPRRVEVLLGGPRSARSPYQLDSARWLGEVAPDRTGRASAVEVRGTVHWLTHRDGPVRALSVQPGVRGRLPVVLGATGTVAWVTDALGEDALELAPAEGGTAPEDTPRRLAAGQLGRVLELVASPDGERLAVATHDGRVLVVAADSGDITELDASDSGDCTGLVFSPDSRWLAWAKPGPTEEGLRQIRLGDVRAGTVLDATPLRFDDFSPAFTADGRYLAFLSYRSFDPVYDSHVFDLHFPGGCRPQLLALAADTPSPFAPRRDGRGFGDDRDGKSGGESKRPAAEGEETEATAEATAVDAEGLDQRVVPFPVEAGRYSALRAAKDGVLWVRHPLAGRLGSDLADPEDDGPEPVLQYFGFASRDTTDLTDGLTGYRVSGDGTRIAVLSRGSLKIRPADRKPSSNGGGSDDDIAVDLTRVRVTVDPGAEWRQQFDENGRIMAQQFWRADLGGVEWSQVLDRYRPLLDRVGSHDELVDLLWETVGELGTSHAYVIPRPNGRPRRVRQGLLGADLERDGDGRWRLARILPGEPSDPLARSPLTAPGVAVRPGDALTAVDGRPVDPVTGPGPLLVGTAGKPVELTVHPAGGGEPRHVVVVPLASDMPLRYQDWVNGRRAYVRERTGGRLGYLHIPDMQAPGWAQLHRDLRLETARDGLVVDVRYNGGGHTSQLVVEKLARKVIGWDLVRDAQPDSYPLDAPRGPVVVVTNEHAGSDGDIINAAVKTLGLGPVIGTRTWGGVVGIDSRYKLVDGTLVTQPKYAFYFTDPSLGWGVENYGVDPDIEVPHPPQDWVAGRDPQLDKGIEVALERLAERPAARAPQLPPPNRGARIVP